MKIGSVRWHLWMREHAGADSVEYDDPEELYLEKRSSVNSLGHTLWSEPDTVDLPDNVETEVPQMAFVAPKSGRFRITTSIYAFTPTIGNGGRIIYYNNGVEIYRRVFPVTSGITEVWSMETILINENDEITFTVGTTDASQLVFNNPVLTSGMTIEEIPAVNIRQLKDAYVGLTFPRDPLPTDDITNVAVYPGSLFRNTSTGRLWICKNTAKDSAVWLEILQEESAWKKDVVEDITEIGVRDSAPCYLRLDADAAFKEYDANTEDYGMGMRWQIRNTSAGDITIGGGSYKFEVIGGTDTDDLVIGSAELVEITYLGTGIFDVVVLSK